MSIKRIDCRLDSLVETKQKKINEITIMESELVKLKEMRDNSTKRAPTLASRYEFYQKLRGYLTDLIECLDEKVNFLLQNGFYLMTRSF
jgi:GC-rich sequence DNA-binding factor